MALSRDEQIAEYGWTALSCDPTQWGSNKKYNHEPKPQLCNQVPIPDTPLIKSAMDYAKAELPEHTFNHSMRVFYYGTFPSPLLKDIELSRQTKAWR
jgi:cyanamide hydratase